MSYVSLLETNGLHLEQLRLALQVGHCALASLPASTGVLRQSAQEMGIAKVLLMALWPRHKSGIPTSTDLYALLVADEKLRSRRIYF